MQSNQPHTFVVVTLDPPIRKGQTLYPHIVMQVVIAVGFLNINTKNMRIVECYPFVFVCLCVCVQFETDVVIDTTLSMSEDLYNTKYKDKLELAHKVIISCFAYLLEYQLTI